LADAALETVDRSWQRGCRSTSLCGEKEFWKPSQPQRNQVRAWNTRINSLTRPLTPSIFQAAEPAARLGQFVMMELPVSQSDMQYCWIRSLGCRLQQSIRLVPPQPATSALLGTSTRATTPSFDSPKRLPRLLLRCLGHKMATIQTLFVHLSCLSATREICPRHADDATLPMALCSGNTDHRPDTEYQKNMRQVRINVWTRQQQTLCGPV
jgi:hypothetical protein